MSQKNTFLPDWREKPPAKKSYRSIFKWGGPGEFKHPSSEWYVMLKDQFGLTDDDFKKRHNEGDEPVSVDQKVNLTEKQILCF